jgi:M6 family metalloprotease-like protein
MTLVQKIKERKAVAKDLMKANPLLFLANAMSSKTRTSMSKLVQNDIEVERDISGIVDVLYIDDFKNPKNSHAEYFLTENGKRYNLYIVGELGVKSNTPIEAKGYVLDDAMVISTNNKNVKVINSLSRGPKDGDVPDSVGNQRTLVLLIKSFPEDPEPFTSAQGHDLVFNGQFQNFMQEQSYNKVSFSGDVFGWIALGRAVNNSCTFLQDGELLETINRYNINLNNYDRIVYAHKDAGGGCSYVGKSNFILNHVSYSVSQTSIGLMEYDRPSWWGVQPFMWTNIDYLLAHELGHALGVVHANSWTCSDNEILYGNCWHNEYGNYFDTMGNISHSLNFNAYFKEQLGWIPYEQILNINQSGSYSITPLEINSGNKFAKIQIPGSTSTPYFVEFRRAIGFDMNLNKTRLIENQNGIFINRIQKSQLPETELLDMSPESSNGNNTENVTLNLPSSNTSVHSFSDHGTGITIGPVLDVSSSSLLFDVNLQSPICRRFAPIVNYHRSEGIVSAGTFGNINLRIYNQDYYGCGNSSSFNVYVSSSSPSQWSYEVSPSEGVTVAQNETGYVNLQFNVPLNTPVGDYLLGIDVINTISNQIRHIYLFVAVVPALTITSVEPAFGLPGNIVTLTGAGFSTDYGNMVNMVTSNGWSDYKYLNSSNGNILFTIPSTINRHNSDGSFSAIPTPEGDYTISLFAHGSFANINFHVGSNPIVSPSATIIGTSTLKMKYATGPSGQYENVMEAEYKIVINAGSRNQRLINKGSMKSYITDSTNTNTSLGYETKYSRVAYPHFVNEYFEIPANSSSTFNVKTYFDPKKMFAGDYHGVLEMIFLGDIGTRTTIDVPSPNITNSLTIIGERSPYIISISATTTPSNQEVIISGVRFEGSGDELKISSRDGVVYSRKVQITNNGQTIKLIPNVPDGDYLLTIRHPETGESNGVGLSVTDPVSIVPMINLWSGENLVISSSTLNYSLNWTGGPTDVDQRIFVHFVDSNGNTRFLNSVVPSPRTTQWSGPISTPISVFVPSNTAVGSYKVMAGLYNPITNARMRLVSGPGVSEDSQLRYQIGTIDVKNGTSSIAIYPWTGPLTIDASSTLSYSLNWTGGPTDVDQRIFVHFVDSNGNTRFLNSIVPTPRTTQWSGSISTPISVNVPATTTPSLYRVMAGLYNPITNVRMRLIPGPGMSGDYQGRYEVGQINVVRVSNLNRPTGYLDGMVSTSTLSGWAVDRDDENRPIDVHVYVDGPAGSGGIYIGSVNANMSRPDLINAGLTNTNHGYYFQIPLAYQDGKSHGYYAYGIDITRNSENPLLNGAPKTFSVASTSLNVRNSNTGGGGGAIQRFIVIPMSEEETGTKNEVPAKAIPAPAPTPEEVSKIMNPFSMSANIINSIRAFFGL